MKANEANLVAETAKDIISSQIGTPVLVEMLKASNNTKALDTAIKKVKSFSPETSVFFVTVDYDEKKIFVLSAVPKVNSLII